MSRYEYQGKSCRSRSMVRQVPCAFVLVPPRATFSLGVVIFRIILGVIGYLIAAFILRAIFRVNKIVELLETISEDIRALNRRIGSTDKE